MRSGVRVFELIALLCGWLWRATARTFIEVLRSWWLRRVLVGSTLRRVVPIVTFVGSSYDSPKLVKKYIGSYTDAHHILVVAAHNPASSAVVHNLEVFAAVHSPVAFVAVRNLAGREAAGANDAEESSDCWHHGL